MGIERQLAKHIRLLNKALRRLVLRSAELKELRHFLRREELELAIYVVPLVKGKSATPPLRFELTDADRTFLKHAGIRF